MATVTSANLSGKFLTREEKPVAYAHPFTCATRFSLRVVLVQMAPAFFELLSRSFLVRVVFCVAIFGLSIVWFEIAIGRPARELVVDSAVRRALAQKQAFDKAKTNTASGEDPGDSIESKP